THYVDVPRWEMRAQLAEEKIALGFYFSGHPWDAYKPEISRWVRRDLSRLEPAKDLTMLAGIVSDIRTQMTKRGKMAFIVLEDGNARVEVSVFNELFDAVRHKLKTDEPLIVEGKVSRDDFRDGLRIVADQLMTLGEARSRFAKALRLSLNGHGQQEGAVRRLRDTLSPFVGGACPVRIVYRNALAQCELSTGQAWRVRLDDELLAQLRDWLSAENVEVV
ncbi:MAG TPA: OB-fold nucleic acid binding domain-containing protein, partial [Rhodocyclaceae bacterium]|nr:OB-fold nucleic acid binding domain-containing protein [Rhodocyclaceae bacterium]